MEEKKYTEGQMIRVIYAKFILGFITGIFLTLATLGTLIL